MAHADPVSTPGGALVIGGSNRALGVVRSLGRRSVPVWVLRDQYQAASLSRYCRRTVVWPHEPSDRLAFLLELSEREACSGWMLWPTTDDEAEFIARHHEALASRYCVITPPWEILRWTLDKRLTYDLADRLGIDHPRTVRMTSGDDGVIRQLDFPLILKPGVKVGENPFVHDKAWYVPSPERLPHLFAQAQQFAAADEILVQEYIPGSGRDQVSYAALWIEGCPAAHLTARRLRQYPRHFGYESTFVQTDEIPAIVDPSVRFLREIDYSGLVEVEYKRHAKTGSYKLLDVNPRVWGWHTLGAHAGINFPYLQWLAAGSNAPPPSPQFRRGAAWIRTPSDLLVALQEMRARELAPSTFLAQLRALPSHAVFALDDPLPAVTELALVQFLWRNRRGHRSSPATLPAPVPEYA